MLVVGLTGNIGSGKSTVARLLEVRGVPVIDADILAREAVAPGTPALAALVERFGSRVRAPDGSLDRGALRHIVFANPADRAALNAIVHPVVQARRDALLDRERESGAAVVVCDIPLLFENRLEAQFDVIILVDAPREMRLARIERDRGLAHDEAIAMVDAQQSSAEKRARAHYVIDNDDTLETLRARLDTAWRAIQHDHLS